MQLPRWRSLLMMRSSSVVPTSTSMTTHCDSVAGFHSTTATCEKWKSKWNNNNDSKWQQPSKSYIRYATRQKRADAKKALKDLLFNSGASRYSFQDDDTFQKFDGTEADQSGGSGKKGRSKSAQRTKRDYNKKAKHKIRRTSFSDDFESHAETIFQAKFGNRWYTWSFDPAHLHASESSTFGFQWREDVNWGNHRTHQWETLSDVESDDESTDIGSASDRIMLGLPATGALKLEDVKNAFRQSALRWHPDKHQGPSQSMAEEKFKLCVNAYKSLCSAFSAS